MKRILTEVNINTACEEVDSFLEKKKTEAKERIRATITLEEALLEYKEKLGSDAEFMVDFAAGLGSNKIRLYILIIAPKYFL